MKPLKIFLYLHLPFAILLFAISGCATAPAVSKTEYLPSFNIIELNNFRFVSVNELCAKSDITYCWDGFSKRLILNKDAENAIIAVGSSYVLVNGKIEDIKYPVSLSDGMVIVPYEFAQRLSQRFKKPLIEPQLMPKKEPFIGINNIILDPGHGGKDPGAIGKTGLKEKEVVLDVAKELKSALLSKGFNVIMTRESDTFIPLSERVEIANKNQGDLFVSLHTNASRAKMARGIEVYYLSELTENNGEVEEGTEDNSAEYIPNGQCNSSAYLDRILEEFILIANRNDSIELANTVADSISERLFIRNRGIKRAQFFVLRGAKMPAILIEIGFITNRFEERNLKNEHYRRMVVEVIAEGIGKFRERYEQVRYE